MIIEQTCKWCGKTFENDDDGYPFCTECISKLETLGNEINRDLVEAAEIYLK